MSESGRGERIRRTVEVCVRRGLIRRNLVGRDRTGVQAELARYFGVTRQRISQVVREVVRDEDEGEGYRAG